MRRMGGKRMASGSIRATALAALLPLWLMAGGGCTTAKATFPSESPEAVWTALVAVAESPDYDAEAIDDRWRVKENAVRVDRENARIEIYRQLRRTINKAGSRPWSESQEWRFRIVMEELEPPTAVFTSRGLAVPAHAKAEAKRYFDDVRALLDTESMEGAGDGERAGGAAQSEPGATQDDLPEPAVRMEDLEPDEPERP